LFLTCISKDKLYLAAYTAPPTEDTPFPPTPIPQPYTNKFKSHASPTKKSKHNGGINPPKEGMEPVYFTVDDVLLYNAFYHDFGPLNVAHCYRFALTLHDILGDPENSGKYVVFYSKNEPRIRANAACLLASYMVGCPLGGRLRYVC
jgi:cell division cycle 14